MRKADLVEKVAFITGTDQERVLLVLESVMAQVKDTLAGGNEVTLRGFGTFSAKKRAAKMGRNIKKGGTVQIPAHYVPSFKPAKEFRQAVGKLKVQDDDIKNAYPDKD